MKRILLFILLLFCLLILLPTFLSLCLLSPKNTGGRHSSPLVSVWRADTKSLAKMQLEAYLIGVVAAEMPASFHEEALKAQAVAARTYIYNRMTSDEENADHPEAAVCTDSTHCKAWLSDEALHTEMGEDWYATYYEKIAAAVRDTEGEIVTYDDEPIVAVFHSAAGGRTENSADVWGGALPYLKSVESAGDASSPRFLTTAEIPKTEICATLGISEATVGDYTRSEGGAVQTITLGGTAFRGTDIRAHFDLRSANFEIEETPESFIFHVKGSGHGVGLSQYGANFMAENGSSYRDILTTYYTDVALTTAW